MSIFHMHVHLKKKHSASQIIYLYNSGYIYGEIHKKYSLDNQSLLPDFYFKLAILYNIMSKTEDVYIYF